MLQLWLQRQGAAADQVAGKFATDGTSKIDLGAAAFQWPV
jgi:hypothetical protein